MVKLYSLKKILLLFLLLISCRQTESKLSNNKIIDKHFLELNYAQKKEYLDSILPEVNKYKNDSIKSKLLFDIAAEYYYLKENKLSYKASKMALNEAEIRKDSFSIGKAFYYMGDCYMEYQKDSAYYYYKESEKVFYWLKNEDRLAKVHYNKAYLLFYEGNYVESEIEVIKALNYLSKSKKLITKYRCYSLQGSNHLELGEYEKALNYFNEASSVLIELQKQNRDKDAFYDYNITNTIDICNVYDKQGAYSKAIIELKKIISSKNVENFPNLYHAVIGNLGYSLMKNQNYEESKKYLKEAIELTKKEENNQGYLYKIIDYGEFHLLTKDTLEAQKYFNEALGLAKNLKSGKEILESLEFLSISDKNNTAKYKTEYIRISDSLVQRQRENREKFARIEYETNKVEENNKILITRNLLLILTLTLSGLAFLTIILIKNKIARKKELLLILQKKRADDELFNLIKEFQYEIVKSKEKEQNRISKELHDGVVNQIYGIRMILGALNGNDDNDTQKKRLSYIKELHKVETEIRDLSHVLSDNSTFNEANFIFLLETLLKNNNELGTTIFSSEISKKINWDNYSSVIKINIYRILQELFLNINKYAKATNCFLKIIEKDALLLIHVSDNGIGFDTSHTGEGIGIKNIKERAKNIDAQLILKSELNTGTTYIIKIKKSL